MLHQEDSSEEDFDPSQLLFDEEELIINSNENHNENLSRSGALAFSSLFLGRSRDASYTPLPNENFNSTSIHSVVSSSVLKLQTVALEDVISKDYEKEFNDEVYAGEQNINNNQKDSKITFQKIESDKAYSQQLSPGLDYIEQPPSIEDPGSIPLDNISYIEIKKPSSSLEEGLLESSQKKNKAAAIGATSFVGQKQKFKDVPFLLLYIAFCLIFVIVNFIVVIKASQSTLVAEYASGTIYRAIVGSFGAIVFTILVSIAIGLIWLALICSLTKPLMWFTFLSIPFFSFCIFILMLTRGFVGFSSDLDEADPSQHSKILSLIPLSVAIIHSFLIHRYHSSIKQSIEIVKMATVVLQDNIDIFGVSLLCLAFHVLFSVIWLISFDRLFLLGHMDVIQGKKLWMTDSVLSILVPFYLMFFWWTSSIIINIERCCIAGTVSQWYFHKKSNHVNGYNPTKVALKRALTTSFGSLSLAGLIMTLVKMLKHLKNLYEKQRFFKNSGVLSVVVKLFFVPVLFLARLVDSISSFSVSYVGISGKPFIQSAQIATSVLKRNFIRALLANYVIQITVYSAIITTSTLTGYFFFMFSADSLHSSHFLIVSALGLGIPFYILKFMMNILLYTTDAVYLCYGIDLEQKTIHSNLTHEILSGP